MLEILDKSSSYTFHTVVFTAPRKPGFRHGEVPVRALFDTGSEIELGSVSFVTRHALLDSVIRLDKPTPVMG